MSYKDREEEICEGCDGRGRCPDRPCLECDDECADCTVAADMAMDDYGQPDDDTEDLGSHPRARVFA